ITPVVPEKTKVNDIENLTEEEKDKVKDAISEKNPDLPEGTDINVSDNGDTTINYPDGSQDNINGEDLVEKKSPATSDADKYNPQAPDDKIPVDDTNNLTEEEKDKVKDAISEKNPDLPEGTDINVSDNGDTTINYPDGSQDNINGEDLVEEKEDEQDPIIGPFNPDDTENALAKPNGAITVIFDKGENGKLEDPNDSDSIVDRVAFYILPGKGITFGDLGEPGIIANDGYLIADSAWSPEINATDEITEDITFTAQYVKDDLSEDDIIGPFDPSDENNQPEIPENYLVIKFNKGKNGKLVDDTNQLVDEIAYAVNPDANLIVGDLQKPKVRPNKGYRHIGWDKKDNEKLEEGLIITALYRRAGSGTTTPPIKPTDPPTPPELEKEIHKLYVIGYPNGEFLPENNMTRAEVAMIFARLLEDKVFFRTLDTKYADVKADHWASGAIDYLTKKGILHGMPDGKFYPENKITRAEYATIIANMKNLRSANASKFTDIKGHWAEANIKGIAEDGIIVGYDDMTFKPEKAITRAEAVTMTNRAFNRVGDRAFIEKNLEAKGRFPDVLKAHWAYTDIYEAALTHEYIREKDNSEKWIKITELGRVTGMNR
ncbi:MAG: S-layer homology domain-containing protein, partial [Andreesenia angusta]|nr:S-layer homology domain-containing protein [Andreesenia angusta]